MLIYGIVASEEISASSPGGPPPGAPARFIAVGSVGNEDSPMVMTTENNDATTWVDRSIPAAAAAPNAALQDIAYSASLDRWVAVGYDSVSFGDPRVIYSDDGGNTWTAATPAPTTDFMVLGVCWTGSAFIAVGQDTAVNDPRVMTSADGITWTSRTSAPTTNALWLDVGGVSGLAIAVGSLGTSSGVKIMTSTNDGASWTTQTPASNPAPINGIVVVSAGTHVAAGFHSSTSTLATSTNGTSWTTRTGPADSQFYSVAWNGSIYVAVGMDLNTNLEGRAASSPTGTTWTARTTDPVSAAGSNGPNFLSVAAGVSGGFVAVGRDDNTFTIPYIMYSAAGTTWTARTASPTTGCILQGVAARP